MQCLGIPIHYRKLSNVDWKRVEEWFEKTLSSWKGKHLSTEGDWHWLIQCLVAYLCIWCPSSLSPKESLRKFLFVPEGVLKKLDYLWSHFFWQNDEQKWKYRLAKWDILCQPKDQGGLGIHNLDIKNTSLLSKWLYKLLTSYGTCQQILCNKYLGSKPLAQVQWKNGDSHFWASLMKVKRDFLRFGSFIIKDGSQVRFWEDI
jgi:hypothetical protein